MALDRVWLREMMVEESVRLTAEMMAVDRNPKAAEIEAEARRVLAAATYLDEGIDFLRRVTEDPEEARARWIATVGPVLRRSIADLRPS